MEMMESDVLWPNNWFSKTYCLWLINDNIYIKKYCMCDCAYVYIIVYAI